jgi:hypothetical protein
MLSEFLKSLTIEDKVLADEEKESFIYLLSQRYGFSFQSAQAIAKDVSILILAQLAGTDDNQLLQEIVFSDDTIHQLPDPMSYSDDDLVSRDSHLWFADCSASTLEWHAINNKDQLLNTLLHRSNFLKNYMENEGRMVDLLVERQRYDLVEIIGKHFPWVRFPN